VPGWGAVSTLLIGDTSLIGDAAGAARSSVRDDTPASDAGLRAAMNLVVRGNPGRWGCEQTPVEIAARASAAAFGAARLVPAIGGSGDTLWSVRRVSWITQGRVWDMNGVELSARMRVWARLSR